MRFCGPQRLRAAKSSLTRPAGASLRAGIRPCGGCAAVLPPPL
jgi:hypothetical protein